MKVRLPATSVEIVEEGVCVCVCVGGVDVSICRSLNADTRARARTQERCGNLHLWKVLHNAIDVWERRHPLCGWIISS